MNYHTLPSFLIENDMYVTEILSWQAQPEVNDQQMLSAMDDLLADLKILPGFLFQNLGKNSKGQWVAVYFWKTAEDAHNSNTLMADKSSMANLMQLLIAESIKMEVIEPLQDSGLLKLNE
jgi:hypothetical protein